MSVRRLLSTVAAVGATLAVLVTGVAAPASAAPTHKGYTAIALDPAVADLLTGAGIAVGVVAPASAPGTVNCPVVGNPAKGVVKHVGGISLTSATAGITLTNFWIADGGVSGVVDDTARVALFTLGASGTPGTFTLALTDVAAGALNATFGVSAFAAGAVIGTATPQLS